MPTGLAYHLLMLHRLLGEADAAAVALNLPEPHPLQVEHVQQKMIAPPGVRTDLGMIFTGKYAYTFANDRFQIANPRLTRVSTWPSYAGQPSLLTTNSARDLALNWLAALRVDTNELLKSPVVVTQFSLPSRTLGTSNTVGTSGNANLPVFAIRAGVGLAVPSSPSRINYQAEVRILGTTRELIDIQVKDWSIVRRAPFGIRDPRLIALYPDAVTQALANEPGFQLKDIEPRLYATPDRIETARALLLKEARRLQNVLGLSAEPWTTNSIYYAAVSPPLFGRIAMLQIGDYEFIYGASGHLMSIRHVGAFAPDSRDTDAPAGPHAAGGGTWTIESLTERATHLMTDLGVQFVGQMSPASRTVQWITADFPAARGPTVLPAVRATWGTADAVGVSCVLSSKDGRLLRASFAEFHAPPQQPLASLESQFTPPASPTVLQRETVR